MPFLNGTNDLSANPGMYLHTVGPKNIIVLHRNEVILTSGSDLNVAAVSSGNLGNPWPKIVGTFFTRLFKGSWNANNLRQVSNHNVAGNYGSMGGSVGYGFRGREFGGIGNMPGPIRDAHRPTYNNLVPIVYGLRDIDPKQLAQSGELVRLNVLPLGPADFTPANAASLQETIL